MMNSSLKTVCAGILVSLTACGGGSVDTTPAIDAKLTANPTYLLSSAVSAFLQSTHDYTLKAKSGADVYELIWHSEPGAQSMFEGHLASTMDYSNTIKKNGGSFAGSTLTDYFDLSPFSPYGGINHTLGNYDVASSQQPLPSVALAGQSGFISNGVRYVDSTKSKVLATSITTWSLEAIGATAAWACVNSSITHAGESTPTTNESVCYKVDSSGTVQGIKIELTLNGQTLIFQ
jgi:hypothetical protein